MNQTTRSDLHTIYGDTLTDSLMARLVEVLDTSLQTHPGSLRIKTRNEENKILRFQGTTYFSIVYKLKEKPVLTAGAIEKHPQRGRIPAMRFRDGNSALATVHRDYKFPYRKPKWTNVEIRNETIGLFPQLLEAEISNFFSDR